MPAETTGELYDFLYRDSSRIHSYYAQLFGGRLAGLEETDVRTRSGTRASKVGPPFAGYEEGTGHTVETGSKRIIDPHDIITTNVFSLLRSGGLLQNDAVNAPHGALIIAQGTLVFVDRHIAELGVLALDMLVAAEQQKPRHLQDANAIQSVTFIKTFLAGIPLPSAFLLQMTDSTQIAGTIKEAGMEEPISAYYFKHGASGLSDVFVIGIKEVPNPAVTLPDTQMIGAGQQAAQGLNEMLFPADAIKVTPLALFRRVVSGQQTMIVDDTP